MVKAGFRDSQGSLQVPLLLGLLLLTLGGFGCWGVLRHWRTLVERQLRLDRCVGKVALEFRDTLNAIEAGNERIRGIRASLLMAELAPPLIPPLEAALVAEVGRQEFYRWKWRASVIEWQLKAECGQRGERTYPLPELGYFRSPPDTIGPQPLEWKGERPKEFRVQAEHAPRLAAAVVTEEESGNVFQWTSYSARWAVPELHFWSSAH